MALTHLSFPYILIKRFGVHVCVCKCVCNPPYESLPFSKLPEDRHHVYFVHQTKAFSMSSSFNMYLLNKRMNKNKFKRNGTDYD